MHGIDSRLAKPLKHHQLLDFLLLHNVVTLAQADLRAAVQLASSHAPHRNTPHVRGILQRRDKHLGSALHNGRSGNDLKYSIKQGRDVVDRLAPVQRHPALLCRTVNGGEIKLLLGGVQVEHKVEDLLLHLVGTAIGLVHLVDDHYGFLAHRDSLLQHEAGLGHTALERIYQQQHTVRHIEHALHLSAEIAVPGSVYDIDFDALVDNGNVLGEDSDAAFALKVVVVQNQLAKVLGLAHQIRLVNHPVHQGGLAVIYVSNDSYVSDFLHIVFRKKGWSLRPTFL